jgi:cytochrome c
LKKLSLILITLSTSLLADISAQKLFDTKCSMCHLKTRPADKSKVIAPAMPGVMRHIKMNFDNKKDAVTFIKDYVYNPSKEKALCMPQKLKRFGVMPSQKANITEDELDSVANWVYNNF